MKARLNYSKDDPEAIKGMLELEKFVHGSGLEPTLYELVKTRASQINGCAFCIDMHTKDAIKNGESNQRIFLISAWREATKFFTEEEQIVLEMTEEITLIHQHGLSEKTYRKASGIFSENQIAQIIMAIVTINAWNRIAVSTHQEIEG